MLRRLDCVKAQRTIASPKHDRLDHGLKDGDFTAELPQPLEICENWGSLTFRDCAEDSPAADEAEAEYIGFRHP
jgi:hypothetical protein